jgi:serine/threonine protein kinase
LTRHFSASSFVPQSHFTAVPQAALMLSLSQPRQSQVAIQQSLGRTYQICRELPGAGMSRVFVAWEPALQREVVVKVLPDDLRSNTSVARFRREILVTAGLLHPNILPVLAAGGDETLWYVMPYITSGSVARRLGEHDLLPFEDARRVAGELLAAVAFAHERGIVHRDIKPGNVLLSEGHAILADFGIARVMEGMSDVDATVASVAAPEAYLAPERPDDEAADLYAVAVLTHEMMTGELPAAGESSDAILQSLVAAHPDVAADSLRASAQVLSRALSREPASRFNDAAQFRRALLEPFLRRRADRLTVEALVRLERGDTTAALEIMRQLVASLPGLRLAYVMNDAGSAANSQG